MKLKKVEDVLAASFIRTKEGKIVLIKLIKQDVGKYILERHDGILLTKDNYIGEWKYEEDAYVWRTGNIDVILFQAYADSDAQRLMEAILKQAGTEIHLANVVEEESNYRVNVFFLWL